jgi:hypothetical protein
MCSRDSLVNKLLLTNNLLSSHPGAVFSEEVSLELHEDSDVDENSSLITPADSNSKSSISELHYCFLYVCLHAKTTPATFDNGYPWDRHWLPRHWLRYPTKIHFSTLFFPASSEEDPVNWLESFELAVAYNRLSDPDRARNFVMYLEGAARK